MAEWLKAADCKFVKLVLHRFESYFFQNFILDCSQTGKAFAFDATI